MFLKKREITDTVFYIIIGIYFFFSMMHLTMLEYYDMVANIAKIVRYACYACFCVIIIYNIGTEKEKTSFKEFWKNVFFYFRSHLLWISILTVALMIYIETKQYFPFVMLLCIWVSSFYDFKKIVKVYFCATLVLMLSTWSLSFLELIPEISILREDKMRYSLGYMYPLELVAHFLFLVICYIYILDKKFSFKDYLIINMINFLLYRIADGRTSFYLITIVSFMALIHAKTNILDILYKINAKIYYLFLMACAIGSIACGLAFNYYSVFLFQMNELLNGRLRLIQDAVKQYGISLFGKKIEWVGFGGVEDIMSVQGNYNFVDCAYAKMLLDYGIVFFILVLIGYCIIYKTAVQEQDSILIFIISIVLVLSIMEPRLISVEMNPFVLLLGRFFLRSKVTNEFFIDKIE